MLKCKHVTVTVTNECNMKCKGCYVKQRNEYFDSIVFKEKIIDELLSIGISSIGFSGGEPLLYSSLEECITVSKESGLVTSLVSNGKAFSEERAKQLKLAGLDRIQFSLDAGDRQVNDMYRENGSFEWVTGHAVPIATKLGIRTTLVAVPNKYLMNNIKEYLDLASELHVSSVYFRRHVDIEGQEPSGEMKRLYTKFLSEIDRLIDLYDYNIYSGDPIYCAIKLQKSNAELKNIFAGCSAGVTSLAIQPNGDINPCTRLPIKLGNAYEDSIIDIWKHNEILEVMRMRDLIGRCGKCPYKFACGGCRADAFYRTHNYAETDTMCNIFV